MHIYILFPYIYIYIISSNRIGSSYNVYMLFYFEDIYTNCCNDCFSFQMIVPLFLATHAFIIVSFKLKHFYLKRMKSKIDCNLIYHIVNEL